ncbi:MAG: hypothetical protein ACRDGM_01920, partial [bacterium]
LLIRLLPQAARAKLFSDECFHAYLAEWIGGHGRLPDRLPEFYDGLWYSYPPLLHILGAVWLKLFSAAGLVELNVALFALLLGALALLPVPGLSGTPRRWAVLLCVANGWMASYAVRFFAEMLTSLLGLIFVLLVLRYYRSERMRDALLLGVATGLALLAKQTALVLPVLLLVLAGVAALGRSPKRARGLLLAALIGGAIALPFLIRNAQLYGSPIYPALARDGDLEMLRLYRMQPGYTVMKYLGECLRALGPYLPTLALGALVLAGIRRRRDIVVALVALCPLGAALNYLSPLHDARHIIPLIPVMALLASIVVYESLRARPQIVAALEAGLLVLAAVTVMRLPDIRKPFDVLWYLPPAYAATSQIVPRDATILSLYTYDTFYYTRRKATWPLAWGPSARHAVLFREQDPDRFLAEARRNGIDYLLIDRFPGPEEFLGSNYGRAFGDCDTELLREGKLRKAWMSPDMVLVALDQ